MEREPGWRSRDNRTDVHFAGVVTRVDGTNQTVRVTNISDEGCRIECDGQLSIGEWVTLNIPGHSKWRAKVRWALLDR